MKTQLYAALLAASLSGCDRAPSAEETGREAGASVDNAMDDAAATFEDVKAEVKDDTKELRADANEIGNDIEEGVSKADNAIDAAARELKK